MTKAQYIRSRNRIKRSITKLCIGLMILIFYLVFGNFCAAFEHLWSSTSLSNCDVIINDRRIVHKRKNLKEICSCLKYFFLFSYVLKILSQTRGGRPAAADVISTPARELS